MISPQSAERSDLERHVRFQPIFEVSSRRVVAMQALLAPASRPALSTDSPPQQELWHNILEHTEVDLRVLRFACAQEQTWREFGERYRLSVPVSARTLEMPGLVAVVSGITKEHRVNAAQLEFALLTNFPFSLDSQAPKQVHENCRALRERGIGLGLLELGTGYNSLGHLARLPLTRIEVAALHVQGESRFVEPIVAMGRSLKLITTAAGVDNERRADGVRLAGFTEMRGNFLAPAMDAALTREWVRNAV
jgi:EAL domain-containing protein (putative c-di-GMP-specific phosphodiesterase class I)